MKLDYYIGILPFVIAIFSMIRFLVFEHRLYKYLRENHTEKWKELTTIFGLGPGYANSRKARKFIFGKCDINDPELIRLMVITRNSYIYMVTGFIAGFLTFFFLTIFNA